MRCICRPTFSGSCGASIATGDFDMASSAQSVASSGLEINLAVSSEKIACGDTVYGDASLFNTLPGNLTLQVTPSELSSLDSWAVHDTNICGNGNGLIQLALFEGYYDQSNVSEAGEPLQLGSPNETVSCIGTASPTGFVFMPRTGNAYGLYGGNSTLNDLPVTPSASLMRWSCSSHTVLGGVQENCGTYAGVYGYYSGTAAGSRFSVFHRGVYTVAASDIWGDTVFAHFTVQ
jgi:hypothetical protein